jgi:hypothetical protein
LRSRATEKQKREGWEVAMRIEKLLCTIHHEVNER